MAFTKKNTKKATNPKPVPTNDCATFYFKGVVDGDPYEGKKYNYINLRVNTENVNPKTGDPYYNTYSVACDPSIELANGDAVQIVGNIGSFFDRDKKQTVYSFYALEIYDYEEIIDIPF